MEFVEPDDGPSFRRPPSLDDRLWRHPSEVGGSGGSSRRLVPLRVVWLAAAGAAVGASALTAGLLLTIDLQRDDVATGERAAATREAVPSATATEPAVEIAARVRPAIAQVRTQRPDSGGSGSAVFLGSDGHLITNAHVVQGTTSIDVVMASGRELPARLIGADRLTDVAVVKVDGEEFPAAELGTAANLQVGQTAIAMGSPLALAGGPSVTVGVISALHRTVRTKAEAPMFDMIQTDAPISAGSSGGALLDLRGRVIGITTAIAVTDVGPEGLGFATPIDVARSVADQLIATGRATHAWMGIEGSNVDGATAADLDLEGGAILNRVLDGGPAQAAGLAPRDIVVKVDGKPVASMNTLVVALRDHRPGEVVIVEVLRNRERVTTKVTLAERPANP